MSKDDKLSELRKQHIEEYDRLKELERKRASKNIIRDQLAFIAELRCMIAELEE